MDAILEISEAIDLPYYGDPSQRKSTAYLRASGNQCANLGIANPEWRAEWFKWAIINYERARRIELGTMNFRPRPDVYGRKGQQHTVQYFTKCR